ncbi:antiterminator [Xenorhabdus bovienii]|uniref:antiterminator Q family protein n=1 Tax=Xenorhabdus bovienii TaxID=40576 RepID=UPI0023B22F42|nr:antiterminator Q family protein [Xenorhabdus bovienii]MDE9446880.1 antiterminator [Xenorhabdus bovienii]
MSGVIFSTDGLQLTQSQEIGLQDWLSKFGTWVYSGRLDKRQSSMIAEFMATVELRVYPERPICNDDDGMLIARVVDHIYHIDRIAFAMLLSRYVFNSSDRAIARYYHNIVKPRVMVRRRGSQVFRKPSMSTCRREVEEILKATEYLIYQPLQDAFIRREQERNLKKLSPMC